MCLVSGGERKGTMSRSITFLSLLLVVTERKFALDLPRDKKRWPF